MWSGYKSYLVHSSSSIFCCYMDLPQVHKEIYDYEHSNFLGLRHQIEDILKSPGQKKN